jgi:hypothetical protein
MPVTFAGETASSKITTGIIAAVPLADAIFIIAIIWPMQKWLQSWQPKLAALAITVLVTAASWVVFNLRVCQAKNACPDNLAIGLIGAHTVNQQVTSAIFDHLRW